MDDIMTVENFFNLLNEYVEAKLALKLDPSLENAITYRSAEAVFKSALTYVVFYSQGQMKEYGE